MNSLSLKNSLKQLFFFLFIIGAIITSIISYKFFPKAFPVLDLKITFNRTDALAQAKKIAEKYNFGPSDYHQAIYFTSQEQLQNYVELEAGGKDMWKKIIDQEKFAPYAWCIRHFQEGNPNETLIQFTPTGKPYGFDEKLSENQPGAELDQKQAQEIAENFIKNWGINLSDFKKIEGSQEKRISGRVDHSFVYERINEKVGESHYRFNIVVSGDKITKLHHFMDIPESFERKYQEMRSANSFLETAANAVIYIVYFFIGCILTIFLFLRKKWLLLIPSLKWGIIISLAQELNKISELPLIWCSYNTAQSYQGFLIQYLLNLVISFIYYSIAFTITFIAAESLTRKAFPEQIQFYQSWKLPTSNSYQMLYRTILGYGLIPFKFFFLCFFYFWGTKLFGWWSPTAALVEPNILGTYMPGLSALGTSLRAGFWEECLFRAVPISLGSIIGTRFGHRKTGIAISLIFQALVFGAAHAGYPSQPWYVRLVELILPSFAFGAFYIAWGLVPVIITHFVFDSVLFALPVFISQGSGSLFNKISVVIGILIPFIIILISRFKYGRWIELTQEYYNKSWQPKTEQISIRKQENIISSKTKLHNIVIIFLLGCISLAIGLSMLNFKPDIQGLQINKETAIAKAKEILAKQHINIGDTSIIDTWKILTNVTNCSSNFRVSQPEKFIWQKARNTFNDLIGNYLAPSLWQIRFAKFSGDIVSRAKEYNVFIENNGNAYRIQTQLPQSEHGQKLEYNQAQKIALDYIKEKYNLANLEEVFASQTNEPNRRDWLFEFTDRKIKNIANGQARIYVQIAGNFVVDSFQFIQEPENWMRKEQQDAQTTQTINLASLIVNILIVIIAIIFGIASFSHSTFSMYHAAIYSIISILLLTINSINNWPDIQMGFETTKSLINNGFSQLIKSTISYIKIVLWAFLAGGIIYGHKKINTKDNRFVQIVIALSLGLIYSSILAFIKNKTHYNLPNLPFISPANAFIPWLSYLTSYLFFYIEQTITILFLTSIAPWTISLSSNMFMLLIAISIASSYPFESFMLWICIILLLTLLFNIFYNYFLRYNTSIIPIITLVAISKNIIGNILYPTFVGSTLSAIITLIVITILAFTWNFSLNKKANVIKLPN